MTNQEENKYNDSPRILDLDKTCLDTRFGDLKFEKALPQLKKMREDIIELEDLDYKEHLTQNEINRIDGAKNNFNQYVKQIQDFTLSQANPQQVKDQIENNINNYYQNSFAKETRNQLIYLRQEFKLDDKTEKELQKSLSQVKKVEKEFQEKLNKLKKDEESVEQKSGIVSSKFLSQEFQEQYQENNEEAEKKWFRWSRNFYISLGITIIISFIIYLVLRYGVEEVDKLLLIEWGGFSILVISLEFFGLNFSVRNYNIQKNLASINRHRRNVAETLVNYLESKKSSADAKESLIKDAGAALFGHHSTGYLSKDQMQISTPVYEMVTKIVTDKLK